MKEGVLDSGNVDTVVQNKPFNYARSGYYEYSSGRVMSRASYGNYWEYRSYVSGYAMNLIFHSAYLGSQYNFYKGHGLSLRCLVR